MSRFNFGSLESEPGGLADFYRVMSDAQRIVRAMSYSVPAGLQTREYAEAMISNFSGRDLAAVCADLRMRREETFIEAGVRQTIRVGAAALQNVHYAGKDTMFDQLDSLQAIVEADIESGTAGKLHVGIVPVSRIRPLPAGLPQGMDLTTPRDIIQIDTDGGTYVVGNDGYEVDRLGSSGVRGLEAQRRQGILNQWESMAVYGEAALAQVVESRAVLQTL